mgnify:CR=1 FL=1
MENSNIDIVITWVNGSDPKWLADKAKYVPDFKQPGSFEDKRFKDNSLLKYLFRGIEVNAPWVNHIYFVTYGHYPEWLNLDSKKLTLVKHTDFIPKEYLPTFNSCTIEMFLWNIPGLSEKFLYANDDTLFFNRVEPSYFFDNEGNVLTQTTAYYTCGSMHCNIVFNSYCLPYDEDLAQRKTIGWAPAMSHMIRPYLRSMMEECYHIYEARILNSITRFRSEKNFNVYLYDHYNIINKKQRPRLYINYRYLQSRSPNDMIKSTLTDNSVNMICINDTSDLIDIYNNYYIRDYFSRKYKTISDYEI